MSDSVNMSLDEIIKKNNQNRVSRTRGRGGKTNRGRGGGRGGGGRGRGRSQGRADTPARSRSRARSQSRSRSQARSNSRQRRSNSRQRRSNSRQRRSNSRARSGSRSRSQLRSMTPKGRAGLEDIQSGMPPLMRGRNRGRGGRGGYRGRLYRSNSISSLHGGVHSRLGVVTRRGAANLHRPLAVAKRGISKRGRGLSTVNRYSSVGLRSDQILKEQRQNLMSNDMIRSQTFRRSRNNSFNHNSQLTVSVINDFAKRRRNSVGSAGYLNKQSLAQLNNQQGGYNNTRRGPGSVKSMGSNKSNRSSRSNVSKGSNRSMRSRGRGGRGANRGVGQNFASKRILNVKLQKEIAAIQGKTFGTVETPNGINFSPTPAATTQTLHERFASS